MTAVPHGPINEPIWGIPRDEQTAALREPLAGIELGSYDERILAWIADVCDTPTAMTIASLLHRARAAQPLADAETVMISRAALDRLNGDSAFLETLFAHGLDNWEGYADAHDDHESAEES